MELLWSECETRRKYGISSALDDKSCQNTSHKDGVSMAQVSKKLGKVREIDKLRSQTGIGLTVVYIVHIWPNSTTLHTVISHLLGHIQPTLFMIIRVFKRFY